jgi:hypothetical protein
MPAGSGLRPGARRSTMNDDELLRYSRHILLDEIGIEGQQRIRDSSALVGSGHQRLCIWPPPASAA